MPTTATRKTAAHKPRASAGPDAVKLLVTDHKEVKALFKAYDKLVKNEAHADEKQATAHKICTLLTVHATVEHATAKDLIAQIEAMSPGDDLYDAKVKKTELDLAELGTQMSTRKDALLAELGEDALA